MTAPAVYAEGLRVLWSLASRGVSATWDRSGVVLTPPDPTADGVIEKLEAALRPGVDGRSYLQRARERHALFLREVKAAKPADVVEREWRRAFEGLEFFSSLVGLTKPCVLAGRMTNCFVSPNYGARSTFAAPRC